MSTVMDRIVKALRVIPEESPARRASVFARSAAWTAPVPAVPGAELPELIASIRAEAAHLNLQVHECPSLEACGTALAGLARERPVEWGIRRQLMCWSDPLLAALDLPSRLAGTDIAVRVVPEQDSFTAEERQVFRQDVTDSFMGVTTADYLLADTGTLVLLGGPGRARSVSLVPSIHVAVVPVGRIVRSYSEALRILDGRGELPSHLTCVTGPSKTADIEATLVHGAHGPREMHLFLVP